MTKTPFYRSRKTLIATTLAVAMTAGATGTYAFGGHRGGPMQGERFEYIFTQLNLTEEQSTQVLEVIQAFAESQREAMQARREADAGRPTTEEREAMKEQALTALSDQLGTVLPANQVEELVTYIEFHNGKMGGGKRHGGHGWKGTSDAPAE